MFSSRGAPDAAAADRSQAHPQRRAAVRQTAPRQLLRRRQQHIALQNEGECFYFIANYHALTDRLQTMPASKSAPTYARDVALDYLALGLDPDKAVFFRQSDVPEVTELAWILATVTNMGLLERAVSYKDKIDKGIDASVGLFTYPMLMAADILIYRSHVVPVGKDQVQHLEMTADIAGKFNHALRRESSRCRRRGSTRNRRCPASTARR